MPSERISPHVGTFPPFVAAHTVYRTHPSSARSAHCFYCSHCGKKLNIRFSQYTLAKWFSALKIDGTLRGALIGVCGAASGSGWRTSRSHGRRTRPWSSLCWRLCGGMIKLGSGSCWRAARSRTLVTPALRQQRCTPRSIKAMPGFRAFGCCWRRGHRQMAAQSTVRSACSWQHKTLARANYRSV